ncbi:MAG: hypothetical protein ACX94B_15490 [Henriciella sp.]
MSMDLHLIDGVLALILVELFVLVVVLRRLGAQRLIPALTCFLLSGAFLVLALRLSLAGSEHGTAILALLAFSFPVHIATLILVWRAFKRDRN